MVKKDGEEGGVKWWGGDNEWEILGWMEAVNKNKEGVELFMS